MVKIYGYTKCSTVKKALKYLDENNVKYEFVDFVQNKLTEKQLQDIHKKSELPIKRMFNTSGNLYKSMKLKDKIDNMELDELYKLLASDGMLVKRPIAVSNKHVYIGFKEQEWENLI